jgi:hypothetical protein
MTLPSHDNPNCTSEQFLMNDKSQRKFEEASAQLLAKLNQSHVMKKGSMHFDPLSGAISVKYAANINGCTVYSEEAYSYSFIDTNPAWVDIVIRRVAHNLVEGML